MTQRTFVAVTFRKGDRKSYTYHWDGEPFAVGDEVKVADRHGDGWQRVYVAGVTTTPPPFDTKPILGKAPEAINSDEPGQGIRPNRGGGLFGDREGE